jgi:ribose 5-phosphate isomerase B
VFVLIAIGSDHAAYEFKEQIKVWLDEKGLEYKDLGAYSTERVDYPTFGEKVAKAVANGECEKGLLFCGSGIGISITANKVKGIRAVVCSEPYSARHSRLHNDTNVLALGSRVVGIELAKMIIDLWLVTPFEGGRHQDRVELMTKLEETGSCG